MRCRSTLDSSTLDARGYVAFDSTLVQIRSLAQTPRFASRTDVVVASPPIPEFVDAVAELRGSTAGEAASSYILLAVGGGGFPPWAGAIVLALGAAGEPA